MAKRRFGRDPDPTPPNGGAVATEHRTADPPPPPPPGRERERHGNGVAERSADHVAHRDHDHHTGRRPAFRRQRDEFGGINWGSAFFGWLVAVGLAGLLTAIASAAGAAIGLTDANEAESNAETIGIVGGALLIAFLAIAYFCGGYVAGRMSRFDGARQGLAVWLFGLIVTIALAALGAIAGSEWNLLGKLDLPRIPIDEGSLTAGGAIALGAILLGTLVAAIFGGKVGERFHRKVDRVGYAD